MNKEKLEKMFNDYGKAFDKLDLKSIIGSYADSFISAGPKGAMVQEKKDFPGWAEKAAAFYRSIGQTSGKILSKKLVPISNEYTMVTVHWEATYEKLGNKPVEFDVSYIVQEIGNEPKIILFISHQDEQEAMKGLRLVKDVV